MMPLGLRVFLKGGVCGVLRGKAVSFDWPENALGQ